MKKCDKSKKSFSQIELMIVLVILAVMVLILSVMGRAHLQKAYDAKYDKVAAILSSNIERYINANTGFRFENFEKNPELFRKAALGTWNADNTSETAVNQTGLLNIKNDGQTIDDFWSRSRNFTIDSTTGTLSDGGTGLVVGNTWYFVELNDGIILAFQNDPTDLDSSTRIMIDVNGKNKGPNKAEKDIRLYNAPLKTQAKLNNDGPGVKISRPGMKCTAYETDPRCDRRDLYNCSRAGYPTCKVQVIGCKGGNILNRSVQDVESGNWTYVCHPYSGGAGDSYYNYSGEYILLQDSNKGKKFCLTIEGTEYCTIVGENQTLKSYKNEKLIFTSNVTINGERAFYCQTDIAKYDNFDGIFCDFGNNVDLRQRYGQDDLSCIDTACTDDSGNVKKSCCNVGSYEFKNEYEEYLFYQTLCVWLENRKTHDSSVTVPSNCSEYMNVYNKAFSPKT